MLQKDIYCMMPLIQSSQSSQIQKSRKEDKHQGLVGVDTENRESVSKGDSFGLRR